MLVVVVAAAVVVLAAVALIMLMPIMPMMLIILVIAKVVAKLLHDFDCCSWHFWYTWYTTKALDHARDIVSRRLTFRSGARVCAIYGGFRLLLS